MWICIAPRREHTSKVLTGVLIKPERRSGAGKFKPGAFRLQNYGISRPERTFLGPAS